MAHFAELNDNNQVLRVVVVDNEKLMIDGKESEEKGIAFCQNLFGGRWIQTSYNNNFRQTFAEIGFIYDSENDIFVKPKNESME